MEPGAMVEVRSVFRGRVRWAFPWYVVADDGATIVLYLHPGAEGVSMGRDADGRYMERWVSLEEPHAHVWREHHVLSLTRRGDAHALWLMWEETWHFRCWYVQLQSPLVETPTGLETQDHALDLVVRPDGTWFWKDEDDFAEAVALGVLTPEEAARVRAEGERAVAARPWPTGWEDWRPPSPA